MYISTAKLLLYCFCLNGIQQQHIVILHVHSSTSALAVLCLFLFYVRHSLQNKLPLWQQIKIYFSLHNKWGTFWIFFLVEFGARHFAQHCHP